ncbi:putative zinc transporter [Heterostelium album PN500]|uniref:Putative zinc transporter n=1 Tax=Heterostelium pallidum (strain ATCC 26659 / Pp 5 / PN500) TaxID=670386 RepID=D3BGD2_HETP5|nr:putative zinc transporter [Heterostelium album PN500]EFA79532.1 putative zinc transporter [Heterostelium album PN500]|eukprot:XP_020431653.1 putative zinc transporter [Heterostelium album PN500]
MEIELLSDDHSANDRKIHERKDTYKSVALITIGVITFCYVIVELAAALYVGSLTLLSDGFHNLTDVASLYIAWWAQRAAKRESDDSMSYGWARAEVLGGLTNGCFLISMGLYVALEAVPRIIRPEPMDEGLIFMAVAGAGLAINTIGTIVFAVTGQSHAHSHGGGGGGHSHGGSSSAKKEKDHGHSHGGEKKEKDHGHSHGGEKKEKAHGHSHGEKKDKEHGHSHGEKKDKEHGHSHGGEKKEKAHGHSHGGADHHDEDDHHGHGHSHGGEKKEKAHGHSHGSSSDDKGSIKHETFGFEDPEKQKKKKKKKSGGHGHGHGTCLGMDLNMFGVFIHFLGDAVASLFVLVTGAILRYSHGKWTMYIDPVSSIIIVSLTLASAIPLVKRASLILLQQVPSGIDMDRIRSKIRRVEGVLSLHDLHVWQLVDGMVVASVHVGVEEGLDFSLVVGAIKKIFHHQGIHSTSIQPEFIHRNLQDDGFCIQNCVKDCDEDWCCKKSKERLVERNRLYSADIEIV